MKGSKFADCFSLWWQNKVGQIKLIKLRKNAFDKRLTFDLAKSANTQSFAKNIMSNLNQCLTSRRFSLSVCMAAAISHWSCQNIFLLWCVVIEMHKISQERVGPDQTSFYSVFIFSSWQHLNYLLKYFLQLLILLRFDWIMFNSEIVCNKTVIDYFMI